MKKLINTLVAGMAIAFGRRAEFCNVAEGLYRDGSTTAIADNAFASLYLVTKAGSDAAHTDVCGASDVPKGVCQDILAAGDTGKVLLLGKGPTKIMQGSGAINADTFVVPDAAGQVKALPSSNGTYYVIGRTITACAGANEQVAVNDCFPFQVTVSS
jgi:Uncharacterized conserved protein (DUF2190)